MKRTKFLLLTADISMILSTNMNAVNAPNEKDMNVKHITSIFMLNSKSGYGKIRS